MPAAFGFDAAAFAPHGLHVSTADAERGFVETNCFVDLFIELLHGLGLEPRAALPFTVRTDLEGDQFTFSKFPYADLEHLFALEIFELDVWHRLVDHVSAEVALGRPVVVEVDAFYLPDTAATTYRSGHVKTSIAAMALDLAGERLGYFHNAGYYVLSGEDFRGLFRLDEARFGKTVYSGSDHLAPYVEVVRTERIDRPDDAELRARSLALLTKHVRRMPVDNPLARYRRRFPRDLAWLLDAARKTEAPDPLAGFHAYSFATLRQLGASFELAQSHFAWREERGESWGAERAACGTIARGAKTFQFKLARAAAGRAIDADALLAPMEAAWDDLARSLRARLGG